MSRHGTGTVVCVTVWHGKGIAVCVTVRHGKGTAVCVFVCVQIKCPCRQY